MKPPDVTPELLCNSCHAVVREAMKRMPPPSSIKEHDVYAAFHGICDDPFRFATYKYTPPNMRYGCEQFLDRYEGEVEEDFLKFHRKRHHPESGCVFSLADPMTSWDSCR